MLDLHDESVVLDVAQPGRMEQLAKMALARAPRVELKRRAAA
jgi:hypothetical protein